MYILLLVWVEWTLSFEIILMFYRSLENRLSPFWILQVYTIICNISNMEGRHQSKLRVWQPSAKKCWAFLFRRFGSWIPIFCLFDAHDKILFFLFACYFMHPGCFVIIVYANCVSILNDLLLHWNHQFKCFEKEKENTSSYYQ